VRWSEPGFPREMIVHKYIIAAPLQSPDDAQKHAAQGSKSGSGRWSHWNEIGWVHYPEIGWSHSNEIRWVQSLEILH
jgi:hypothetical protein